MTRRVRENSPEEKMAVTWAAGTLTRLGAELLPVAGGAWDVRLPDGSWAPAENARELCLVAKRLAGMDVR